NNQWAISCPVERQTAAESIAAKGEAYGIPGVRVDGNDVLAVFGAVGDAILRARAGEGPTLIEAVTMRRGGHSTSDDPSKYVSAELLKEWKARDPLRRFRAWLLESGRMNEGEARKIEEDVEAEIAHAAQQAEEAPRPGLETIFTEVYAETPAHLRNQRDACIQHHASRGEDVDDKGEFPL
ncbi:MAG: thiamine pyrophosphate-dependent dehydrogenase E1 component subunit alpha, partial [Planctomycetota bacterium]